MKPRDKWGRRPGLVAKITTAVSGAGAAKKPTPPADRPVRIDERGRHIVTWPDDDLEDLENPRPAGWLGRRPRGWLWRRRE